MSKSSISFMGSYPAPPAPVSKPKPGVVMKRVMYYWHDERLSHAHLMLMSHVEHSLRTRTDLRHLTVLPEPRWAMVPQAA